MLSTIFWLLVAPAALAGLLSNRAGRRYLEHVEWRLSEPPEDYAPPAVVIVPVKGLDHELHRNLRTLMDRTTLISNSLS